jgi:DNA-nicking Smr family endonuclease
MQWFWFRNVDCEHQPMNKNRQQHSGSRAKADVASDDRKLFRDSIGEVRPLSRRAAPLPETRRPEPLPRQFERDEAAVRDELLTHAFDPAAIEIGDEILYLKPGQPERLLKQLRRGQFSIRAEIDLHQMTVAVARDAIRQFLEDALAHDELCVRIVHGKGLRSAARGPVIKRMTEQLLRRRDDVLAFASALPAQGGTGAVLVLLRGS